MASGSFATAINCMDGRTQIPVIDCAKRIFRVRYVDMITEPGPIRLLSDETKREQIQPIRRSLEISAKKHGSRGIVIVGHYDCAVNPVGMQMQIEQIVRSIETIKSWGFVKIIRIWVDERWKAHIIRQSMRSGMGE